MRIIDREIVQDLLAATDPDAALVVHAGHCVIKVAAQVSGPQGEMIIIRRADLAAMLPEQDITPDWIERIALCLDNTARDSCG